MSHYTHSHITERIIGSAYRVANELGVGFLEKVYENALAYEMEKSGLQFEQQSSILVKYSGVVVGNYIADILVEDEIIVELKAIKNLEPSHFAQCMNYLRATNKHIALLINFGNPKVEIKRIINT